VSADDWGVALGGDASTPKVSVKTKQTNLALMVHFKQSIPFSYNGEVNSLALMKCFKDLRANGVSYADIHKMIDMFFQHLVVHGEAIKKKQYVTWRMFITQKNDLLKWVTVNSPDNDVSEWAKWD